MRSDRRRFGCLLLASAFAMAASVSAPLAAEAAEASPDKAVQRAIDRGVELLWSKQLADGSWETTGTSHDAFFTVGPTAICTYALLESGVSPSDARMARALKFLGQARSEMTYCLAFRALAYAAAMRYEPKYRQLLRADVRTLVLSVDRTGGYTYFSRGQVPGPGDYSVFCGGAADNSNTQYGLLGVWAGALHDEEVPKKYWELSLNYWLKRQAPNGGWGYSVAGRKEPYLSMTLAGLASVCVCADNLYSTRFLGCLGNPDLPAVRRALAFVEEHFDAVRRQGVWYYYTLYGIERVALATGYKYFGKNDWYRVGVSDLIARQAADGSWAMGAGKLSGGACSSTSYALLFLLRGQRPVLLNRLEYDGDWNNRPRSLANLTRWFTRQFEREVHWQIVSLKSDVKDWHDAPLLCITGSKAPKLTDEQIARLRTFVHQGGAIFSITECGGQGFRNGIRELYRKLFPKRKLAALPPGHEIYRTHYRLSGRPALFEVSNGVRPLAIHTDDDLARAWQAGMYRTASSFYQVAVNVVAYTNDKTALAGGLRSRGTSLWPAAPAAAPRTTVKLARLRHGGDCDPEPLAHERFARLLGRRQKIKVELLGPMDAAELAGSGARRAVMTGTGELTLAKAQKDALKSWLEAGGTLLIDAAGGDEKFAESAEKLLREMFGPRALRNLAETAEILNLKGFEIKRAAYRGSLRKSLGDDAPPRLRCVLLGGRPAVYFSPDDITCGLLGNPSYTIRGYEPETAFAIMRNFVIRAAEGTVQPEPQPKPQEAVRIAATASVRNGQAGNAVDGDPATRWDTGRPMREGDWFSIDLGRAVAVEKLTVDTSRSPQNHMRGFRIYVSRDGKRWQKGLESTNKAAMVAVKFPGTPRLRYIRLELTEGHDTHSWSIHEVLVQTK